MKVRLSYIFIGILLAIMHSCTDETFNVKEQASVVVSFSMNVNSLVATRAGVSNGIDVTSIKVLAYNPDGSFVAELPMLKTEQTANRVQFLCAFTGTIPQNSSPANAPRYKFMVLANCTNDRYVMSYDTNGAPCIEKLSYSYPLQNTIPLWGVTTYKFQYQGNELKEIQELGVINVLRAAAKIRVKLSPKLKKEGYDIIAAKIKYIANTGYSVPANWNNVSETGLLHANSNGFRPYVDAVLSSDVNLTRVEVEDTIATYIYVPEISTGTTEVDENAIALVIGKGEGDDVETFEFDYSKGVKFRDYDTDGYPTGERFNIVRNHFYDYTITNIQHGLKFNLKVADWDDAPEWDLDFSAPIHTKLLTTPDAEADAPTEVPCLKYDNSDASGEKEAFVGYFKMESPKGMTWKPTLANASTTDYEVRVYSTDGVNNDKYDILVKDSEIEASANTFYKIVVVAKNPNNIGNVIKLGLVHTATWNDEATPLLIINKGDYNNGLYYPWESTNNDNDAPDIHWISIIQK